MISDIKKAVPYLAIILLVTYGFSLLARYYWFFDLFSHFKIQYALGGFIIAPTLLCFRKTYKFAHYLAPAVLLIAVLSVWDIYRAYDHIPAPQTAAQDTITVAHYNKLYRNQNYQAIRQWLQTNKNNDILFIQESGIDTIEDLKQFKDLYPYQFPENAAERGNDISVLSKTPFVAEYIKVNSGAHSINATKVTFQKDNIEQKIHIYSMHTIIPMDNHMQKARNAQLAGLAGIISEDDHPYIIATGDWNSTPYSPFFQDFKDVSGLIQPAQGYFPAVTWPSLFILPALKIPIDHFTHSQGLQQLSQKVGPANGSDHHSLIATFAIKD